MMSDLDAPVLFTVIAVLALVVICVTAAIEAARPERLEWDNDALMCPGCGSRKCHVSHPVRPWVERGPR